MFTTKYLGYVIANAIMQKLRGSCLSKYTCFYTMDLYTSSIKNCVGTE